MDIKYNNQICALLKVPYMRIGNMIPFGGYLCVTLQAAETPEGPWEELSKVYQCEFDTEIQNKKKMMILKCKHLLAAIKKCIKEEKEFIRNALSDPNEVKE